MDPTAREAIKGMIVEIAALAVLFIVGGEANEATAIVERLNGIAATIRDADTEAAST